MIDKFQKFQRKRFINYLCSTSAEKFVAMGQKKVIPNFHKLIQNSPAYQSFLKTHGIKASSIQNLEQFAKKVPPLSKEQFFSKYTLNELLGEQTRQLKLTMTSSGFSKKFAYGFISKKALQKTKLGVDTTFDYWFDISNRKSFFINCMPMGLHVETSLPMAEVSVRSDMALALLKKVAPHYDQTIIVGDPHFIKKLIQEGNLQGIPWKTLRINIITGQDWLPENLRSYLAHHLGINLNSNDQHGIYATMGMTEMGLNVFHESFHSVAIRRALMSDSKIALQLGVNASAPPCIFHYYPFMTYIETTNDKDTSELLFTSLDKHSLLPVARYATGDTGKLFTYQDIANLLQEKYSELIPDLQLPIGMVQGRMRSPEQNLSVEAVKEGLYANWELIPQITGLFKIVYSHELPEIQIHLEQGVKASGELGNSLHHAISQYLPEDFTVRLIPYYEFTEAMTLNYEQKLAIR